MCLLAAYSIPSGNLPANPARASLCSCETLGEQEDLHVGSEAWSPVRGKVRDPFGPRGKNHRSH